MKLREIHNLIPFDRILRLALSIAVFVQLIIITSNHLSGYYVLSDFFHFLSRFTVGSILSFGAAISLAYPDLFTIHWLKRYFSWQKQPIKRIAIELILAIFLGIIASIIFSSLSHALNRYEGGLFINLIYNSMIFSVCNVILMTILEGWIFFIEGSFSKIKTEELENTVTQLQFETLKSQIDSHFMFNSLNVLSGLVNSDPGKAQHFIEEFSSIYRYVMETIEKPLVTLKQEIRFARSYLYLQQIRYGDCLAFSVNIPSGLLDTYIPPLSMQVMLENVCKHNIVNEEQPLFIEITAKDNSLLIRNNLQLKSLPTEGKGMGQKNLIKRYQLLGYKMPRFNMGTNHFTVTLPLIVEEY
jgi:hypothetical protein